MNDAPQTATTTDDPRIRKIKESQVYALVHEGTIVYVGETTTPLRRRLAFHRSRAEEATTPIYEYIEAHVESPAENLSIRALDYESEQAAIDAHSDTIYNVAPGSGAKYQGHEWTSGELDVLKNTTLQEAADRTGATFNQCRRAKLKLRWMEPYEARPWTEEEEELLGTDTDAAVGDKIGRSQQAVWMRRTQLGIEASRSQASISRTGAIHIYLDYTLTGATLQEVADEHGVSQSAVGHITRQETHRSEVDYEGLERTVEKVESLRDGMRPSA